MLLNCSRPRTHISHYYFKKHLGASWLEEEEGISFIGIACFSLNQLRLLYGSRAHIKRACSFCCLAWNYTFYWLFQKYVYVYHKRLRWNFTPKKVTEKVDTPKSVDAVTAALCPLISKLRGRWNQCQIAPRLSRSPNISKCQVSDSH